MKVLLTGASGFIGSAIGKELIRRGHNVTGLIRNKSSEEQILRCGMEVCLGDITNPKSFLSYIEKVDAVIHTAFNHNFSQYEANCKADGDFLDIIANAMIDSNKILIATSATTVAASGEVSYETDSAINTIPRSASERFLAFRYKGLKTAVVRLPPIVHGEGDKAFMPALIALAKKKGVSAYINEGENQWCAVHRLDAARLYCDVLENSFSTHIYHGVTEPRLSFRSIAQAIGKKLNLPVRSISSKQADEHFGWLATFAKTHMPASSTLTTQQTGWHARENRVLDDLNSSNYSL
ncbi:SDR family oxidoreductase [Pseudoalteromonas mariniglutinosa]|uniref:SDR family oxidoreductase n=1 Tax=Pseudoalteromonas mariniglutinosa TaxID=206042 RepID=UPI00385032C2